MDTTETGGGTAELIGQLVFVGFNSRVAALDRETGSLVWDWRSPKGSGFVALLLDGDRLLASINGYTYCLDPITGRTIWANPLTGFGIGVPSIATVRGASTAFSALGKMEEDQRSSGSSSAASSTTT